ncbi:hypothetical protein OS493_027634 [Desmophyllum pertusum]|uniref:G-protein coupled receptors family 1 profile domain-containing protein n=1 Tax=Desmophyllum pertusum TaxID=174260 RepID=A0A9X0D2M6_9CNID|nr:hypothetical protein OS493_027634 [Desmophyllum pertusum]
MSFTTPVLNDFTNIAGRIILSPLHVIRRVHRRRVYRELRLRPLKSMEKPLNISLDGKHQGHQGNAPSNSTSTTNNAQLAALAFAYLFIILASLFGNSILIHIIRTRHLMKTATNYLILNQAFADLLITFFTMPEMLRDVFYYKEWFGGGDAGLVTCKLVVWLQSSPPFCSIWSLAAIAVDRYFAVARPLHLSPLSRHIKLVIASPWFWAVTSAVSISSMAKVWLVKGDDYFCVIDYSHVELTAANITSICFLFLNFFVPLLVMTVLYTIVCWRLRSREIPGEGANHERRHEEAMKTAKKVTRMMIVVVVLTYRQKISEGRTDRRTEMNLSFLAKNGCFNMQFMINSSSGLQKEGNTTSVFEETHFQFLWLIYFAYVIIFLASLFGNSVIIRIIRTDNSMKTTTNYLIVNQACADLVITIAQLTNAIHYSSTDGLWLEGLPGLITCKVFQAILFTPPSFSVWILVSIAVDRFYAVTRPLKLSPVSQHLKKMILFFWLWSFAFSANFLLNETFKKINESYYCDATNILSEWAVFNIVTLTLNVFCLFQ